MKLTETQVFNLIKNAYGFVDSYGSLMMHNEHVLVADDYFTLQNIEGERIVLSCEEASLDLESFEVIFNSKHADRNFLANTHGIERFTILIVPNGKTLTDLIF